MVLSGGKERGQLAPESLVAGRGVEERKVQVDGVHGSLGSWAWPVSAERLKHIHFSQLRSLQVQGGGVGDLSHGQPSIYKCALKKPGKAPRARLPCLGWASLQGVCHPTVPLC